MSRLIRFDQFLPVEKSKFLLAIEAASLEASKLEVSKMEITPPLMPGCVTGLVTVKLTAGAIAFSYEDSAQSSWVGAFEEDLRAGRFRPQAASSQPSTDATDTQPAAL